MLIFFHEVEVLFRMWELWKFQSASEVFLGHALSSWKEVSVAFMTHLKILEIRPSRCWSTYSFCCGRVHILQGSVLCVPFSCDILVPSFPFWARFVHVRKEKKEGGPSDSLAESSHHRSSTVNPGWGYCVLFGFISTEENGCVEDTRAGKIIHLAPQHSGFVDIICKTNKSGSFNVTEHHVASTCHLRSTSTPVTNADS